jgi:hypothetical protein
MIAYNCLAICSSKYYLIFSFRSAIVMWYGTWIWMLSISTTSLTTGKKNIPKKIRQLLFVWSFVQVNNVTRSCGNKVENSGVGGPDF